MSDTEVLIYGFSDITSDNNAIRTIREYLKRHQLTSRKGKPEVKPTEQDYLDRPYLLTFPSAQQATAFMEQGRPFPQRIGFEVTPMWKKDVDQKLGLGSSTATATAANSANSANSAAPATLSKPSSAGPSTKPPTAALAALSLAAPANSFNANNPQPFGVAAPPAPPAPPAVPVSPSTRMVYKPPVFANLFQRQGNPPKNVPLSQNTPNSSKVLTNFVQLKMLPMQLFEYKVTISPIQVQTNAGQMESRPIKQRSVLQRVFNAFGSLPAIQNVRWATNFESLWSLDPIHAGNPTSAIGAQFDTQSFQFERQDGVAIDMPNIHLDCTRVLNLDTAIDSLQNGSNHDDFQRIVTGLNALMTKTITSSAGHNTIDPSHFNDYFLHQVGPNKFFHNESDFHLGGSAANPLLKGHRGFFTSVRPGEKNMLLNVNLANGCFLPPILVSDFIQNLTKAANREGERNFSLANIQKMLHNVQVRLIYDRPTFDGKTPNAESHRRKFITEFGGLLGDQMYATANDPTSKRPVREYFQDVLASNSSWMGGDVYCVNVGSRLKTRTVDKKGKGKKTADNIVTDITTGDGYENFDKAIWIPSNLLEIVPFQPYKRKLGSKLSGHMVNNTCEWPLAVLSRIRNDGFRMLGLNTPTSLTNLGLGVRPNLLQIPAGYLQAPILQWGKDSKNKSQSEKASWNLIDCKFANAPEINGIHMCPLLTHDGAVSNEVQSAAEHLMDELINTLKKHGHSIKKPNQSTIQPIWLSELDNTISTLRKSPSKNNIVVFILPDEDADQNYATIKSLTDRNSPVHTICCLASKVVGRQTTGHGKDKNLKFSTKTSQATIKPSAQYVSNLCLKICMKVGGAPWYLDASAFEKLFAQEVPIVEEDSEGFHEMKSKKNKSKQASDPVLNTIILGADLTHPGSSSGYPSIAAVVGSIDGSFVRYPGSMALTPAREEIIATDTLKSMVASRLRAWSKHNSGRLPTHVLFYRDGVSESQLEACRQTEITAVEDAWTQVKQERVQNGSPISQAQAEVTFVVVVKRHHTRFFPLTSEDIVGGNSRDINSNLKPGLIVRRAVTMPHYPNFYLQSHNAIKGTARPAHYIVLQQSSSINSTDLENITNALCYAFPRATKGVSYCAPAYLADRLCDRGAKYLIQWIGLDALISGAEELKKDDDMSKDEQKKWFAKVARFLNEDSDARAQWIPATSSGENPWAAKMDDVMFYL